MCLKTEFKKRLFFQEILQSGRDRNIQEHQKQARLTKSCLFSNVENFKEYVCRQQGKELSFIAYTAREGKQGKFPKNVRWNGIL